GGTRSLAHPALGARRGRERLTRRPASRSRAVTFGAICAHSRRAVKSRRRRMASISARSLLLNSAYEPLKVITWQRAVTLLWLGKVEVIRQYDRDIRSVTFKI